MSTATDEFLDDSIERCPHDPEHPYYMVSRSLIRDEKLSPECRWLLIYLLSNKDGWNINVRQVVNHLHGQCGRDKVYKIFQEAIDSGYMTRIEYLADNKKRYRYRISEQPKFKKSLLYPDFQETGNQYTENTDSKGKAFSKINHIKDPLLHLSGLPTIPAGLPLNGRREDPLNPKALGINSTALGVNPRALGVNPKALQEKEAPSSPYDALEEWKKKKILLNIKESDIEQALKKLSEMGQKPIYNVERYLDKVLESIVLKNGLPTPSQDPSAKVHQAVEEKMATAQKQYQTLVQTHDEIVNRNQRLVSDWDFEREDIDINWGRSGGIHFKKEGPYGYWANWKDPDFPKALAWRIEKYGLPPIALKTSV